MALHTRNTLPEPIERQQMGRKAKMGIDARPYWHKHF